jgi:hypothetical protein
MNEQPFTCQARRFAACGRTLATCDAELRKDVAALDLPPWYAANIHLLVREASPSRGALV